MWNHFRYKTDSLIWSGDIDWENFQIIVDRIIKQYFNQPNYYKIDSEPVFSVFSLGNLLNSFKGIEGSKEALDYFRQKVKEAGFLGLHLQLIGWGIDGEPFLPVGKIQGSNGYTGNNINEILTELGINSITTYNWIGSGIIEDYLEWGEESMRLQMKWDSLLTIPYFSNVSIGWDNTPRYPERGKEDVVHYHNTPESFGAFLQKAREYVKEHPDQTKLITINSWNEWVEGSYLEPDMKWGYGYLEAVKEVMSGKLDQFE